MKSNWKKNIVVFMSSQAISLFGSSLVQYAITWHITITTQSGVAAMLAIVCGFVPTLLLSPFAGVWADRYNRKMLVMLADGFIALSTLVLAIVYMAGYRELWLLFVVMIIRSLGSAVQTPAIGAMLPDIVPNEHLTRVSSINGSVQSLITLMSPMLSGALLGLVSLELIFFIDVFTAVLAIGVMLLFLKMPAYKRKEKSADDDYFGEMKQGFAYIGKNKHLKYFFLFCAIFYFLAGPVAFLTPLQMTRFFGADVWRLTVVESAFSVGMVVGGIGMVVWGGMKNRVHTMAISVLIMGVCTVALGMPKLFWVHVIFMGLFGLSMPILNTPAMVFIQERADPEYIGRVFGVMTMLSSSMMPLSMLVFGPLGDIFPIEWTLLPTGVCMILGAGLMLRNRPLVRAGLPVRQGKRESG